MSDTNPQQQQNSPNVPCQVCGERTISEYRSFDICPVCGWEDDGLREDPDKPEDGPNGTISLTEARKNYRQFGNYCGLVKLPTGNDNPK